MPRNCTCLIFSRCKNGICTWVDPCLVCWNAAVMSLDVLPGSLCRNTRGYLDMMGDHHSLTHFRGNHFSRIPLLQLVNLRTEPLLLALHQLQLVSDWSLLGKKGNSIVLKLYNNFRFVFINIGNKLVINS